jgi:hypothetical protein
MAASEVTVQDELLAIDKNEDLTALMKIRAITDMWFRRYDEGYYFDIADHRAMMDGIEGYTQCEQRGHYL